MYRLLPFIAAFAEPIVDIFKIAKEVSYANALKFTVNIDDVISFLNHVLLWPVEVIGIKDLLTLIPFYRELRHGET